jgi:hypothetical protein
MIKILGVIMGVGAATAFILGMLSAFGSLLIGAGQWPSIILGVIFFLAGISLIEYRKDTDQA